MYVPVAFRESDPAVLREIIGDHGFGLLVTSQDGVMEASHLPFRINNKDNQAWTLQAHLARANPQTAHLSAGREVLVVFQGPHAYISPSWYADQQRVPTWNYVAVHVYGTPRILGAEELIRLLKNTVDENEARFEQPWRMESLESRYVDALTKQIMGFEVAISRVEGKLKLSQNRGKEEQRLVAAALENTASAGNSALAKWLRRSAEAG